MATKLFILFITVCVMTTNVLGDIYMQNPRGSNDRLNEDGSRDNDQRLFDSQDNAQGGYCWGPALSFYEGSILTVEWTNQHSCGNDNTQCDLVLQYMCSDNNTADSANIIRDGTTTNTIPTSPSPTSGSGYYNYLDPATNDTQFMYGMNEDWEYYYQCQTRSRNQGLFTADQNLNNGAGAMATRQNPGGTRYGFECSEERDYYPYWHPTPWKDIMVMTNDVSMCGYYQSNSQNVLSKNFCNGTSATQIAANNADDCTRAKGTWVTVPSWGLGAPDCLSAPWNRDNHLGNGVNGFTNSYNWTLPSGGAESCLANNDCNCVLRIRYNVTVGEVAFTDDWTNSGEGLTPVTEDPTVPAGDYNYTLAINTAQTGRTFQDRSYMFHLLPRPNDVSPFATIYNLNVRGKRGNIVQVYPATEYDFVPTFLSVNQGDYIHFQWTGCDTNPDGNAGNGAASTDRSNIVQIADMSMNYPMTNAEIESGNALFSDPAVRNRMAFIDQVNCLNYTQLAAKDNNNQNTIENDPQNCYLLNGAPTPHFSGALVQMNNMGSFYYMSTRNNDFSNRSQKASISVSNPWPAWKTAVIVVSGFIAISGGVVAGMVFYAKRHPLSRIANVITKIPGLNRI